MHTLEALVAMIMLKDTHQSVVFVVASLMDWHGAWLINCYQVFIFIENFDWKVKHRRLLARHGMHDLVVILNLIICGHLFTIDCNFSIVNRILIIRMIVSDEFFSININQFLT